MKMRISKNNLASFLCGGVVCLTACISMGSNDVEKVIESRPVVSSMTLSPDVPSSVPFCGKLIDITRYDMREAYDRELSSFTYFHSTTMLLIKRANRYFPVIEPILKANGIPDDFKYLAVIESHLDPRVSSPARAVGMWQLLEGTAREYGLTITPTVDERCHVEKATGAACRYLVEETTRYIYRIMAIKQIFENPSKYGFVLRARDLYKPISTVDVAVSQDIQNLSAFAKEHGITYADLKRFNPWLRDRKLVTGGKTYKLSIPQEKDMYYKTPNTEVYDSAWVVSEN